MQPSPVIRVIWPLAAQEVLNTGHRHIEPEHLLMALLRFAELNNTLLREGLQKTDPYQEIVQERDRVRDLLKQHGVTVPDETISLRLKLQKELGRGDGISGSKDKIHRSQESRRVCSAAEQIAHEAGQPCWTSLHLLEVLLVGPTPGIEHALSEISSKIAGKSHCAAAPAVVKPVSPPAPPPAKNQQKSSLNMLQAEGVPALPVVPGVPPAFAAYQAAAEPLAREESLPRSQPVLPVTPPEKPAPPPAPVSAPTPSPMLASLLQPGPAEKSDPGDRSILLRTEDSSHLSEPGKSVHTITGVNRENLQGQHAEECLKALLSLHSLISAHPGAEELLSKIPGSILSLLPGAGYVMVLKMPGGSDDVTTIEPIAIVTCRDDVTPAPPSRKMVKRTLQSGHSELHVWKPQRHACEDFTFYAGVGWALCSPIVISSRDRYVIYAAGEKFGSMDPVRDLSLAVISMIAEVTAQYLKNQHLQYIRGQIAYYFPPALREIVQEDPASPILLPQKKVVSILSFDIRGFSKATERAENPQDDMGERTHFFLQHYHTVGDILSAVAQCVFDTGGIVIDYQGDAVLACWGAPLPLENHAEKAISAAMNAVEKLISMNVSFTGNGRSDRPPFGIGIASGEVIAGKMSAKDHLKYQVIGSTVNLASRIEGLTKYFGIPVLIAGETAKRIGARIPLRRVGKVRPAGMNNSLDLHEPILRKEIYPFSLAADEVETYHHALKFFEMGKPRNAGGLLDRISSYDPARRFLVERVGKMIQEGVPKNWDGVIEFAQK